VSRYTDLIVVDLQVEYVAAATEAELERNVQAALDSIALARVVTAILLAGPGQGGDLSVMIEHGASGVGFVPDAIEARFYLAEIPAEISARRAAAVGRVTAGLELKDSDLVATSAGAVTAGMLLFGTESAERNTYTGQSDWYIDEDNGSDTAEGDSPSTALRSHGELERRLGSDAVLGQDTKVHILSPTLTGPITLRAFVRTPEDRLRYLGENPTQLASGTVTAKTSLNAATNTPLDITDSAIGDWDTAGPGGTSLIGHRVRLTSGANVGAVGWLVKRVTATQARCSPFQLVDPLVNASWMPPLVEPAVSDSYVVEQLPIITAGLKAEVYRLSRGVSSSDFTALLVDSVEFEQANTANIAFIGTDSVGAFFSRCRIGAVHFNMDFGYIVDCLLAPASVISLRGTNKVVSGGAALGIASFTEALTLARHWLLQSGFVSAPNGGGVVNTLLDGFAVFDATGGAISLSPSAKLLSGGSSRVWGSGGSDVGLSVPSGAQVIYANNKPSVTGSAGDTRIGGSVVAYAAIPTFDTTKACGVVQE
jgi:hypothetical protein